ncbi:MAG: hypothetical protein J6Y72_03610 [Bacteroidales bacterium]|nr:hypothetical protein [Bacteroidales bacterium]
MRRFTISLLLMLLTVASFAQFNLSANITNVPQGISYQAVVRDGSNIIAANEEFEVQITISAELANGTTASEYTETHTVKTNENGLFTLVIGQGSSSQQFSEFNWAIQGATYKIATQTPYGSDTAQLLSVPFAFYAANAGNIDTKAIAAALSNEDVQKLLNFVKTADIEALLAEYAKKDAIPTVPTKVSAFENDANYLIEHQDISGKANKSEMTITAGDDADKATIQLKEGTSATVLTAHQSLEGYASINDIPTKVSELENDAEYLTSEDFQNAVTKAKVKVKVTYKSYDYSSSRYKDCFSSTARNYGVGGVKLKIEGQEVASEETFELPLTQDGLSWDWTFSHSGPTIFGFCTIKVNGVEITRDICKPITYGTYSISQTYSTFKVKDNSGTIIGTVETPTYKLNKSTRLSLMNDEWRDASQYPTGFSSSTEEKMFIFMSQGYDKVVYQEWYKYTPIPAGLLFSNGSENVIEIVVYAWFDSYVA